MIVALKRKKNREITEIYSYHFFRKNSVKPANLLIFIVQFTLYANLTNFYTVPQSVEKSTKFYLCLLQPNIQGQKVFVL